MQHPLHSFAEACLNTATGFILSILSVQYIFPMFGIEMSIQQNLIATSIMTVVSVARSYAWRRIFNRWHAR